MKGCVAIKASQIINTGLKGRAGNALFLQNSGTRKLR